jgi:type I restriction enzyme, S subunit
VARLAELCNVISDQCLPDASGSTVYVGLEHIDSGAFRMSRYGDPSEVRSSKSRFRQGDILYGKLRPYLDKAILADRDGICSTDILVCRSRENISAAYLIGLFHAPEFLEYAASTTQGVNHPRTSWSAISEFEWDVPEKPEQEKVAAILWNAQLAIEIVEKLIAVAHELKQAVMRRLFNCGLNSEPRKETEIGQIPKSWDVRPLEALREFLQYGTSVKCDYHGKGNPVVRIPNVVDGRISTTDLKWCELADREVASLQLQVGDLLFIRTNGVRERVGRCAVYRGDPARSLFASYLIRARCKGDVLNPDFLQYFSSTNAGAAQLAGRSSSAADGKFNVNMQTIDSVLVPVPKPQEQQEIARILLQIDQKIAVHERKRDVLRDLFKTLLCQLMTGQVRVHDLDIERLGSAHHQGRQSQWNR